MSREEIAAIETAWTRIDAWLAEHAPEYAQTMLRGPVSPDDLAALEAELGAIPPALCASLAIHDGMSGEGGNDFLWIPYSWAFDSASDIARRAKITRTWKTRARTVAASAEIGTACWNDGRWFGFASDGQGNLLVIDLAPGPRGRVGQVVEWEHDGGDRAVVAPSLLALLERGLRDLETGIVVPVEHADGTPDGLVLAELIDSGTFADLRRRI